MSTTINRSLAAVATGALLVTGLAGCGDDAVKKSEVEKKIQAVMTSKGEKISDVKCDDDLKAKKGATTNCTGKVRGTKQKLVAKVSSIEGKTVTFSVSQG